MIISHSHHFIFLKSAKTAGTSVEAALSQHCTGSDIVTPLNDFVHNRDEKGEFPHHAMNADEYRNIGQHVHAVTIRDRLPESVWQSYFKFSIARNPWDRVVSLFTWKARNSPKLQPKPHFYNRFGVPFDQFHETRKLFTQFVKAGNWQTNDRFYIIEDTLCVDYIIRYENLVDDTLEVCRRVGIPPLVLPRLKSGMRPGDHLYSEYYNDETKTIVAERHKHDLRLFGYRFGSD